jgi:hypothetical protein
MAPPVPLPRIDRPGMRFIVYGAGAVGVVVEARLFQSGYNVFAHRPGRAPRRDPTSGASGCCRAMRGVTLPIRVVETREQPG